MQIAGGAATLEERVRDAEMLWLRLESSDVMPREPPLSCYELMCLLPVVSLVLPCTTL